MGIDPAESDPGTRFNEAQAEMDAASKLDPASPAPDTGRGDIELFGRENYFDAEKYYREAIKKDPNGRDAYIGLAYVHLHRGEADEAIGDARKGVELGSEAPASHNVLGEAFLWKGDNVQAAAEFNRAIGLSSTKAAADSTGAFELNSARYDSHTRLGEVYYLEGEYELAKAEFDQALKLATSWNYNIWMAQSSSSLGFVALKERKSEAVDRFKDALKWDPNNPNVHFAIGVMYALLKDKPEKAKVHWEKALNLRKGPDPLERMERVVYNVALGTPGSVDEMSSILREHPPIGMMRAALDDADSLVTFGIQLPTSQQLRKMISEAIEEALRQSAQQK
jgi:tetratricopeptide (TPR) repeat protein